MSFGGYIAYTVRGYKCVPFGTPDARQIIAAAESAFDLPASVNLRPGRVCLRRREIVAHGQHCVSYSAMVGVSEPTTTRPGSFLAFGVVAPTELASDSVELAQKLIRLLNELASATTKSNRFLQEPSPQLIAEFIARWATDIQEVETTLRSISIGNSVTRALPLLLLCSPSLDFAKAFNQICDEYPSTRDFYLLDESARDEIQQNSMDYEIETWPPKPRPQVTADFPKEYPSLDVASYTKKGARVPSLKVLTSEPGTAQGLNDRIYGLLDDLKDQQYAMVKKQRAQQVISYAGLGVAITLAGAAMALSIISYQGLKGASNSLSTPATRLEDIERQLKEVGVVVASIGSNKSNIGTVAAPSVNDTLIIASKPITTIIKVASDRQTIKTTHCPDWNVNLDKFKKGFNELNSAINSGKPVPAKTTVLLPAECAKIK
jgi:hypothetical protein